MQSFKKFNWSWIAYPGITHFEFLPALQNFPNRQSSALQIALILLNPTAFTFPVFNMERLARIRSAFSESSFNDIVHFAIITSMLTMIGMA